MYHVCMKMKSRIKIGESTLESNKAYIGKDKENGGVVKIKNMRYHFPMN